MSEQHNPACFQNHMGIWMMHGLWMAQAVNAIKTGIYRTEVQAMAAAAQPAPYEIVDGDIAIIGLQGPLMKMRSKYGGTSTVDARRAIRTAVADQKIKAILLDVESPGGHVSGTQELGGEIMAARQSKPVFAQVTDLGASAAYWAASQAEQVFANEPAEVGSIGTYAIVEDTSKMHEKAGVQVHVISTGEFKGAFADGTIVTEPMLQDLQKIVISLNEIFLAAVMNGRKMSAENLNKIADGRVFMAAEAQALGLIDGVQTIEQTLVNVRERIALGSRGARVRAMKDRLANLRRDGQEQ